MQHQPHIPLLVIKLAISKWQVISAVSAEKLYLFVLIPVYNLDYSLFIVWLTTYSCCYWFFLFIFKCINNLCSCWFAIICWTLILTLLKQRHQEAADLTKKKEQTNTLNNYCDFLWLILFRFLPSTFYALLLFFELAQDRPYSLSTFKRVTPNARLSCIQESESYGSFICKYCTLSVNCLSFFHFSFFHFSFSPWVVILSFYDSLFRSYCLLIHDIYLGLDDLLKFEKKDTCSVSDVLSWLTFAKLMYFLFCSNLQLNQNML